jgi:hypothetical protein
VMILRHFLFAMALAIRYIVTGKGLKCKLGVQYGVIIGLILAMPQLAAFSYLPIPMSIALLWMLAALIKSIVASMVIAKIYKFD